MLVSEGPPEVNSVTSNYQLPTNEHLLRELRHSTMTSAVFAPTKAISALGSTAT